MLLVDVILVSLGVAAGLLAGLIWLLRGMTGP